MEEELSLAGWKWATPMGGFNLWIQLPESTPMDKLLEKSIEQSISFVPGSIFDPLKEYQSWIRMSYSYLNETQLRDGLRRFVRIYHSLTSAQS